MKSDEITMNNSSQKFQNGDIIELYGESNSVKGIIIKNSEINYYEIQLINIPIKVNVSHEILVKHGKKLQTL